jgi:hypothetical protein
LAFKSYRHQKYSIKISPSLKAEYTIENKGDGTYRIVLRLLGGTPQTQFEWKSLTKENKFPSDQIHIQNPTKLKAGKYQVIVTDSCQQITENIEIKN